MSTKYNSEFYRTNAGASQRSASAILGALLEIHPAHSLLDVGCGIGTWGRAASDLGVTHYTGVDGDYVRRDQLLMPPEDFVAHDLHQPLRLGRSYDLGICIEVAEHLPPAAGAGLVQSLCAHAPVVLFSAAIPGQGGVDHVNEQWQSHWAAIFAGQGYDAYDCVRPRVWDRDDVAEYYRQNALVYVDRRSDALAARFGLASPSGRGLLDVVHPATYRIKSDLMRWPLATVLRGLPAMTGRVIRNRLLPR